MYRIEKFFTKSTARNTIALVLSVVGSVAIGRLSGALIFSTFHPPKSFHRSHRSRKREEIRDELRDLEDSLELNRRNNISSDRVQTLEDYFSERGPRFALRRPGI